MDHYVLDAETGYFKVVLEAPVEAKNALVDDHLGEPESPEDKP